MSKDDRRPSKMRISPEDYIVAIPTYKRYAQVFEKSITTLINGNVLPSKIHLFVANKEEYRKYKEVLPLGSYHKIIIGKKGIMNQRNFMNQYFPEGTCVLYLDDDVEKVLHLNEEGLLRKAEAQTPRGYGGIRSPSLIELKNIDNFIIKAFNECKKRGIYLWGIYPVNNIMFMKPRPKMSFGLRFILGTFYGQIIRHSKDLVLTVQEKEDFQNSILHYIKDHSVIRFDKVSIKTKFYNPDGGIMGSHTLEQRREAHKKAATKLKQLYPQYGEVWMRKNGVYEFRLKPLKL